MIWWIIGYFVISFIAVGIAAGFDDLTTEGEILGAIFLAWPIILLVMLGIWIGVRLDHG